MIAANTMSRSSSTLVSSVVTCSTALPIRLNASTRCELCSATECDPMYGTGSARGKVKSKNKDEHSKLTGRCCRFGIGTITEFYGATEGTAGLFNHNKNEYASGAVGRHGPLLRMIRKDVINIRIDPITEEPLLDKDGHCIPVSYQAQRKHIQLTPYSAKRTSPVSY